MRREDFSRARSSWVGRYAHWLDWSRLELLQSWGFDDAEIDRSDQWGVALPDDIRAQLVDVTGLSAHQADDMTLRAFDYRALRISEDGTQVALFTLWGQSSHTRGRSLRRATRVTVKPADARRRAVAAPMPLEAPVTIAVRVGVGEESFMSPA